MTTTKTRKTIPVNPPLIPRYAWAIFGALLSYVLIYLPLSLLGDYHTVPSGQTRGPRGQAISDQQIWQPWGLRLVIFQDMHGDTVLEDTSHRTQQRTNLGGYIFFPLIVADRWLVHRTKRL